MPKVSIIIPVYNEMSIVETSIDSALGQDYNDKEIVVIDDCSTDDTYKMCEPYPVKLFRNEKNLGLAGNLNELIKKSTGEYIVILCGDDVFTHPSVVRDMVKHFERSEYLGVLSRYYYQYMNGYPGAVMTIRGDILTASCQPSGVGFRRTALKGEFPNKLFVEVPTMVKRIMDGGWIGAIMNYDTIAARLHPGLTGNEATKPGYYRTNPPQSPTMNWYEVTGKPIGMYLGFIQIKNRAPWLLLSEIKVTIKINPKCLLNIGFWFCVLIALIVPGCILRPLSNFYRHRITRHFVKIIRRPND